MLMALLALTVACSTPADPTPEPATATAVVVAAVPTEEPVVVPTDMPPTDVPAPTAVPTETEVPATLAPPATLTSVPTSTPIPATATPTNTPTPEATATSTPEPTPTQAPAPPPRPPVNASPGNPTPYLSRYRLITYYGSPWGPGLGILGNQPLNQTIKMLWGEVSTFQGLDSRHAMPAYHMVTTVANQNPPEYRHLVDLATLDVFVNHANNNEAAAIIDIQPGRVDIQTEFERIRYLMYQPHVHLAIDPEFDMTDEQIPNVHVGQTPAEDINWVQAQLNQIAIEMGVKRVLILHQFKASMLPDKANIQNYPHVELVIDSDGTFNTDIKVFNYLQYANEPGFEYGGLKIFYNYDDRIMTAEEVMRLNPAPAIVIYQ